MDLQSQKRPHNSGSRRRVSAHANWLLLMANCAAYLTTLIELHTAFEVMLLQGNEDYRSQQRSFESWDTIDQCDDCIRLYIDCVMPVVG